MSNEGAVAVVGGGALTAADMRAQVQLIQQVMREVMKPDVHFGYIPGTEPRTEDERRFRKPSLLKAGAEKLCMTFRLGPDYEIVDKEREGDHLTITSKCTLTHIPSGQKFGSALGSCSTMETKYAYRKAARVCPECKAEAIIKGKEQYGGGWLCFKAKGGCGAKFKDGDAAIEQQESGKVANDDKADQYNTVLKMANKRALLAVVLNATAASDIFSQDLLDDDAEGVEVTAAGKEAAVQEKGRKRKATPPEPKATPPAGTAPGPSIPGAINEAQAKIVRSKAEAKGVTMMMLCTHFKVESVPELQMAKINDVLEWLDAQ